MKRGGWKLLNINENLATTDQVVQLNTDINELNNQVNELNNQVNTKFKIDDICAGLIVLTNVDAYHQHGYITLPEGFNAQNTTMFFGIQFVSGTVCDNTGTVINWHFIENGQVYIRACMTGGLVSGHLLSVSYLAVKRS